MVRCIPRRCVHNSHGSNSTVGGLVSAVARVVVGFVGLRRVLRVHIECLVVLRVRVHRRVFG